MNTWEVYIPIDINGPIRTGDGINIQRYNNQNPVLFFQLFDGNKPTMLDDTATVSIAFTNTNNESTSGSGNLEIVNPHRATISYELSNSDITMSGLVTITLGIQTNTSLFTVQCVALVQDIDENLYKALTGNNNNSGCGGDCVNCSSNCCVFPCCHFSEYCRSCRRCKWAWFNNTMIRPLDFNKIKVCKTPPPPSNIPDFEHDKDYERSYIPFVINSEGILLIKLDNNTYMCDFGHEGSVYLIDKTAVTPTSMYGLYFGTKNRMYYKISEKYVKPEVS